MMVRAILAGLAYFILVFLAGVALGVVRVLAIAPRLGDLISVLLELPVILAVSWIACGLILRRMSIAPLPSVRAAMGASAFAFLMTAEFSMAMAVGGTSDTFLRGLAAPAGIAGLGGQILFAVFPLLRKGPAR